ncbi:hypothetical protein IMG5_019900 [Ichthyophthirius multifiliis]|uniref:Uncharacterized protein n=1 Tax=Ichthyophthirius multifiliis TaxID=5932 RepID=G0QKM7_ICHMU|nr:hypothetical protein IMG5_019900 [Ichthyophthirius multifiliis]EGR34225.1 hypothetical protein IMG5_019900 [Ichthyophthirius multifiliis]|eukprot:XP_004039529.1 hypothetical protein IMG5_019900 [Ichthyophthirius multifiliis]
MGSRPEYQCPPEIYYNKDEASKYSNSTRIIDIQYQLTERCIELLNLPENESQLILDIGCGSGLSGEVLSEDEHTWIGIDISRDMLNIAIDRETQGDIFEIDMGQGFSFRHGIFDAAISVSALQWLCVASKKAHNPIQRLKKFFTSLYNSLKQGGRAVLQFYPDGSQQLEMITTTAMKCGFNGGVIVDFPNSTKAKKLYLVINAGGDNRGDDIVLIEGKNELDNEEAKVNPLDKRKKILKGKNNQKPKYKSKEWIQNKKERQRAQGKDVRPDSKYTGKRRGGLIKILK